MNKLTWWAKMAQDNQLPRRRRLIAAAMFSAAIIGGVVLSLQYSNNPFPAAIRSSANFPLCYPDKLPGKYSLDKNYVHIENQIVFFSISDKSRKITVSEQQLPKTPPDLGAFVKNNPSFIKINVLAGSAVVGVDSANQSPVAILETNTTLINLSGTKDTPLDAMDKLVQSLQSAPQ